MSQLLDTLIGMDPTGDRALLLCTIMAALLGILLLVGFGLVRQPKRGSTQVAKRGASSGADLGLPTLLRLNRSIGKTAQAQPDDSPSVDSVRVTP